MFMPLSVRSYQRVNFTVKLLLDCSRNSGSTSFVGVSMGSKMAAGTRVVQVVKPHVPLIKFPERLVGPSQPSVLDNLKLVQQQTPAATRISQKPTAVVEELRPPSLQNVVPSSRTLGVADSVELVKKLPPKYRRKPIEKDEMEYIQRGGPE